MKVCARSSRTSRPLRAQHIRRPHRRNSARRRSTSNPPRQRRRRIAYLPSRVFLLRLLRAAAHPHPLCIVHPHRSATLIEVPRRPQSFAVYLCVPATSVPMGFFCGGFGRVSASFFVEADTAHVEMGHVNPRHFEGSSFLVRRTLLENEGEHLQKPQHQAEAENQQGNASPDPYGHVVLLHVASACTAVHIRR